jgi:hypothetical protein
MREQQSKSNGAVEMYSRVGPLQLNVNEHQADSRDCDLRQIQYESGWKYRKHRIHVLSSLHNIYRRRLTTKFSGGTPAYQHAGAPAPAWNTKARPPAAEHFM